MIRPTTINFHYNQSIISGTTPRLNGQCILGVSVRSFFNSVQDPEIERAFGGVNCPRGISGMLKTLYYLRERLPRKTPADPTLDGVIKCRVSEGLTTLTTRCKIACAHCTSSLAFSKSIFPGRRVVPRIGQVVHSRGFRPGRGGARFVGRDDEGVVAKISITSNIGLAVPGDGGERVHGGICFVLAGNLTRRRHEVNSRSPTCLGQLVKVLYC